MVKHIHITGASGSGTTTLGQKISEEYGLEHFDSDDYFWQPTDPPYQKRRPIKKRQKLLFRDIKEADGWVISGSLCTWGDIFTKYFDLVIFLWVPTEIRIKRLKRRERKKFGSYVLPGGDMFAGHQQFINWASKYDRGDLKMRSKLKHELWLKKLDCPVLRIEGEYELEESFSMVEEKIKELRA